MTYVYWEVPLSIATYTDAGLYQHQSRATILRDPALSTLISSKSGWYGIPTPYETWECNGVVFITVLCTSKATVPLSIATYTDAGLYQHQSRALLHQMVLPLMLAPILLPRGSAVAVRDKSLPFVHTARRCYPCGSAVAVRDSRDGMVCQQSCKSLRW